MKISSIDIPKYRASLKASWMDGLYRPFSREPIVCRDTSSALAKSSCLIPRCFRSSSSRFFIGAPFCGKYAFHMLVITEAREMSSVLSVNFASYKFSKFSRAGEGILRREGGY